MCKVTVFMPVYNTEKYLREAIDSILNQTYTEFEFLIIDDGSSDNSVNIIKSYNDNRIKLIENKVNSGLPYTRNLGMDLVKSQYIALMDSDDICELNRLEKQVEFLDLNSTIDIVTSDAIFVDKNNNKLGKWNTFSNPKYVKAFLLLSSCIPNSAVMMRKNFVEENNLRYNEECFIAQDYRFFVEASLIGNISSVQEPLLRYRVGHNSITKRSREINIDERKNIISKIQKYALESNGFQLDEDELCVIYDIFAENTSVKSNEQLINIYDVFKKIVNQSEKIQLDNCTEIKAMCRKRFAEKVDSFYSIWD